MPFPPVDRVIYQKNPLEEVICQVRFAPILKIEQSPANFQEAIRADYPLFEQKNAFDELGLPVLAPFASNRVAFDFLSEDRVWTVGLTREFLALSTSHYRRWEDFETHFEQPFQALLDEYKPAFFSRVGLRYRNIIRKPALGLQDVAWGDLLNPHIAGILSISLGETVKEMANQTVMQLDDNSHVLIQYALVKENDDEFYVIDSDFFTPQRTEQDHVFATLRTFNQYASRLFRWCISNRLHEAMVPNPIA